MPTPPQHERAKTWIETALAAPEPVGVSELVLSGFLRVVTMRRVVGLATTAEDALRFAELLAAHSNVLRLRPGERHWDIFMRLCQLPSIAGKRVADAYHAALAIETGSEWITTDHDFSRFPGLRWRNPLLEP